MLPAQIAQLPCHLSSVTGHGQCLQRISPCRRASSPSCSALLCLLGLLFRNRSRRSSSCFTSLAFRAATFLPLPPAHPRLGSSISEGRHGPAPKPGVLVPAPLGPASLCPHDSLPWACAWSRNPSPGVCHSLPTGSHWFSLPQDVSRAWQPSVTTSLWISSQSFRAYI